MSEISSSLEELIKKEKNDFWHIDLRHINSVIRNLTFVYHSVVASEHLLSCAIERIKSSDENEFNTLLNSYLVEHREEETDHDKWLAEDLISHGVSVSHPDENAISMIGAQYYMIHHVHPACLLGYMAVVEGVPTPIASIEQSEAVYGPKLFRFSRFHAIKDQFHKVDLFRIIDNTPDSLIDSVSLSVRITLRYMRLAAESWRPKFD